MPFQLWSQDVFSKGELSPLLAGRISIQPYYNGLKTATNVLTYPQGAAGKRFGTIFQNVIQDVTNANQIFFKTMQYLNECLYLMVFTPNLLTIYLEGIEIQQISTPIGANEIPLIDHTVIDNIFRICVGIISPQDITRSPSAANLISAAVSNELTLTTSVFEGLILPVRFATTGSLPTTVPQIQLNRTYFIYYTSTHTAQLFSTAEDAKARINSYIITDNGAGSNFLVPLNNWSIGPTPFSILPVFDFDDVDYSAITFTPGALSGYNITLTASSPVFLPNGSTTANSPYIGGTYSSSNGNVISQGALGRIIAISSATVAIMNIVNPFITLDPNPGASPFSLLTQVAWSDTRGWPRCCSSFQNRAFFANNDVLPNGLWGSVINDYNNFDDSEVDADNAISWYPTSDDIAYIRFIVPYRSLTIHTNSGVFSTPLSVETAITPLNFSLTIQDSTPAQKVQPRGIDNQIVILSGNDAHSLLWDGFNNAYQSNIISIANEQLIRDPVDEAAFVDLIRAGSRYMLIVNAGGSLAIYQTLISEDVQGFTPAILEQDYGNAYFRWVATSTNGRGWFVCERELATPANAISITGFTGFTLTATASSFSTTRPTAVLFSTTDTMPTGLVANTWYWVIGVNADEFMVFTSQANAKLLLQPLGFSDSGTDSEVNPYPLATYFTIEELNFNSKVDMAFNYDGPPANTFSPTLDPTSVSLFNAQTVKINGDGYGFTYVGIDNSIKTIAHGVLTNVSKANMGFPINVVIEPLPLSIFGSSPKTSNILTPTHIREVNFMFADTIGGNIVTGDSVVPISLQRFDEVQIGVPPAPTNGIFEYGLLAGWDDYTKIGFKITHSEPFDIKLIGIFYKVEA